MTDSVLQALPALISLLTVTTLVGLATWWRPGSRRLESLLDAMGLFCLVAAGALWVLRIRAAGHLPVFGTFESSLSLAVAILLVAAIARWVTPAATASWPLATAASTGILAHGMRYDPTVYALTISERSWVVDVHAVVAWLAFGVLTLNAAMSLYLVLRRHGETHHDSSRADRRFLSTTLSLGFLLHTSMLVSGSFYKFLLFGQAWSFDPIETLGFVVWLAYGTLLHLHLMAEWGGRRLARWCLTVFVLLIVSYRGIVYFPAWSTYHIFDMDLRIHLTGGEGGTP